MTTTNRRIKNEYVVTTQGERHLSWYAHSEREARQLAEKEGHKVRKVTFVRKLSQYGCGICGEEFVNQTELDTHELDVHNVPVGGE